MVEASVAIYGFSAITFKNKPLNLLRRFSSFLNIPLTATTNWDTMT